MAVLITLSPFLSEQKAAFMNNGALGQALGVISKRV